MPINVFQHTIYHQKTSKAVNITSKLPIYHKYNIHIDIIKFLRSKYLTTETPEAEKWPA